MSLFFYNLFLSVYSLGIHIAALWNPKARLWIRGRESFPSFSGPQKTVWMHCASLGEFEQGRPLLEEIRRAYPSYRIVVTFFSPSGYEIRKNYSGADAVLYLPMDGKHPAAKFIDTIQPSLVLWIKYEYWYHYLAELKKRDIPVLLISGIFRESQPFFKSYGGIWKEMLHAFRHLFVQNAASLELLQREGLAAAATVSGDTRFDRVIAIAERAEEVPLARHFCGNNKVVVAGSTWIEDEMELVHYVHAHPEIKFIIAPHEVDKENLADVKKEFKNAIFYSALQGDEKLPARINVLIIDNIGMLSRLYRYADVTYVGGGFNKSGIHNVLEAAVYGKPVLFGPVYKKFAEARGLVAGGGAFSIDNAPALERLLNELFNEEDKLARSSSAAKDYVYRHRGATGKIMHYIAENRLLIS